MLECLVDLLAWFVSLVGCSVDVDGLVFARLVFYGCLMLLGCLLLFCWLLICLFSRLLACLLACLICGLIG